MKYNDIELNELTYKKALKFDKRSFSEYYFALLKMNHLLIFAFYFNTKDFNPQIIKTFLFFFFFAMHFSINALFFNDSTMHKIYIDEGSYNIIYQIPQIIYSSLISAFIDFLLKYLSLPERNIIKIKNEKSREKLDSKVKSVKNVLKFKFAIFFVITFFILSFFTCYITCFCGVYINTQIHLIKDSFISFGLSLLYPFGIYLIPCLLRIFSLRSKVMDKKCIYKLSQFLENI